MKKIDIKLLETVNEDLTYLSSKWNQDIDDASLRIASPILRRLLIDGMLGKAAGILNMQIRIMAPMTCAEKSFENINEVGFYQYGGAKYKGTIVQSFTIYKKALSKQEVAKINQDSKNVCDKSCPIKISTYMKQTSFIISGISINREEVIKYVVNKLGGAHYDNERKTIDKKTKITLEHKYSLMDGVRDRLSLVEKNAIYYELLSIGQRIINSRDVHKLRKEITKLLSIMKDA